MTSNITGYQGVLPGGLVVSLALLCLLLFLMTHHTMVDIAAEATITNTTPVMEYMYCSFVISLGSGSFLLAALLVA